jgi:mitochondrial chaperone BCS1
MASPVNCTMTESGAFNTTAANAESFQDLAFSMIISFAPFLKNLPDWMKLAILGTVLETCRRYLFSWYYALKESMFLTMVFDSNDSSFRESKYL